MYFGSSQFSARMQRRASLRSRDLQTSLRPFTSPKEINLAKVRMHGASNARVSRRSISSQSILVQIGRPGDLRIRESRGVVYLLTIVRLRFLDHTPDCFVDVINDFLL